MKYNFKYYVYIPMTYARYGALCGVIVFLGACSFLERNTIGLIWPASTQQDSPAPPAAPPPAVQPPQPIDNSVAKVEIQELKPANKQAMFSNIELIWVIPPEPVDAFIIHYGTSRDNLSETKRVNAQELDKYEDRQKGFVYRYQLDNMPKDKPVFIAVSAAKGENISPASEIWEVAP